MRLEHSLHQNFSEYGWRGIAQYFYEVAFGRFARRNSSNVYNRDWDVLVLLDCARQDMIHDIKNDWHFIDKVGEHITPGTSSANWMRHTFTDKYKNEMAETVHITGNPNSDKWLKSSDFSRLEEVWRENWDQDYDTVLPRPITDRAIALHRRIDPKRMIVHYMQPHPPFVPYSGVDSAEVTAPDHNMSGRSVEELAEEGYSRDELYDFHVNNLRYVLDDVDLLLSNINADRVVISADHGQALGEGGKWGHPGASTLDCLRKVPWVVTSASDSEQYQPDLGNQQQTYINQSTEEKLFSLGYKQ